jgi:hypothetical protein
MAGMRRIVVLAGLVALMAATSATAALPKSGILVPGRSLGGVRLGEQAAGVERALGREHGVCRGCARTTWYFTYKLYDAHGLAVELTGGRVSGVYTLWQPPGWHGPGGLELGAYEGQIVSAAGPLITVDCSNYEVLVRDSGGARTAYFVANGTLWAFGLFRRGASPCR